jgi:hypothetical protein
MHSPSSEIYRMIVNNVHDFNKLILVNGTPNCYNSYSLFRPIHGHLVSDFNTDTSILHFVSTFRQGRVAKMFNVTKFGQVYDMIYLLTAIGLSPGGSSTVHIYTKQYTERHKTNNT